MEIVTENNQKFSIKIIDIIGMAIAKAVIALINKFLLYSFSKPSTHIFKII